MTYSERDVEEDERYLFDDRISKLRNYNLLKFDAHGVSKKKGIISFVNTIFIFLGRVYGKRFSVLSNVDETNGRRSEPPTSRSPS